MLPSWLPRRPRRDPFPHPRRPGGTEPLVHRKTSAIGSLLPLPFLLVAHALSSTTSASGSPGSAGHQRQPLQSRPPSRTRGNHRRLRKRVLWRRRRREREGGGGSRDRRRHSHPFRLTREPRTGVTRPTWWSATHGRRESNRGDRSSSRRQTRSRKRQHTDAPTRLGRTRSTESQATTLVPCIAPGRTTCPTPCSRRNQCPRRDPSAERTPPPPRAPVGSATDP